VLLAPVIAATVLVIDSVDFNDLTIEGFFFIYSGN
jgi:hypothetical protein